MFSFYFQSADHIFNLSNAESEKEFSRMKTLIPPMTKTDMGHSDSQQLPKFSTFDYFRSNPEILWVSPLQRENEDSIFTDNLDAVDLKDETPAEFTTVGYHGMIRNITVSQNNDTDNARPESNNASRRLSESTWFTTRLWNKCMGIIGWRKSSSVPVQATRVKKAAQDKWMTQVPVSVFEICMAASNKSHPVSTFHVRTFSVLEVIFLTKKLESLIAD